MHISLNSSEIEIIFKDEREDEIFNPEKALENFLNKNLDKFLAPLIPEPIKGDPGDDGEDGKSIKGDDGVTPIKGVDYFTKKEVSEIKKTLKDTIISELPKSLSEDEINIKFEDILKKINKLPTGGGGAMFLRQLMDVNVGTPIAQQYGLTYNPSRSEFSLTEISIPPSSTPTLQQVTDEGNTTTNDIIVPDEAYGAGWNGSMEVPTKNAIYDKIQTISPSIGGTITSGTKGSVLFINPSSTLAQDNRQFYYDFDYKRLSLFSGVANEQVTNGSFTGSAAGWTVPSGMAYSSNSVSKTSNGTGALSQSLGLYVLREYQLTYTISNWTVGTITPSVGGFTGTAVSANGTYTERFVATSTAALNFTPSNTARFTIDTVSVVPMIGTNTRSNLNVGGLSVEGNWANGSPGTTRAMTFNNDGSYSWTDYRFGGTLRASTGANSSGGYDIYTSGGNGAAYYSGNAGLTSNTLYSYNYSGYFYHYGNIQAVGHGMFGGKVGAGTGASTTPTSTLTVNGGEAKKTRRVTTNTTLDDTAYFWIVDASTPSCNGTPSVTTCSTYTGSGQAVCESHLPCSWYGGSSCAEWNGNQSECDGHSGCTYETASCSGFGDESTCTSYGCSWSGTDCSPLNESECGTYSGSGCTVNTSDCSAFNGNESGCSGQSGCSVFSSNTCSSQGDESSCVSAGCSWDGMSCTGDNSTCTGSYFTGCTGTYYTCSGTYYTGTCSGTWGAACSGTAACSGYGSEGACEAEAGCNWLTAATITLPDSAVLPNYACAIYNGSSSGADVNIAAPAGHTTDVSVLSAYKDSVILQGFNDARQCSEFSSAGACTPTGCTANYFNCSWNSGDNTCSGDAVCDGIGDQSTCESTSYFSSCSGTWYASKNYYRLAS